MRNETTIRRNDHGKRRDELPSGETKRQEAETLKGRGAAEEEARSSEPGRAGIVTGLSDRTREALPPVVSPTPDTEGPPCRDEASPAPFTKEEIIRARETRYFFEHIQSWLDEGGA